LNRDDIALFRLRVRGWRANHARLRPISTLAVGKDAGLLGFVEPVDEPIVSVFTGQPCVVADLRLEVFDPGRMPGDIVAPPMTAVNELRTSFWIIDDAGDRVLVAPAFLVLLGAPTDVGASIPEVVAEASPLGAFLLSKGILPVPYMGIDGAHRFRESVILPGDRVQAFGRVAETHAASMSAYRSGTTTVKSLVGADNAYTFIRRARERDRT
jgi:hypothetical protein